MEDALFLIPCCSRKNIGGPQPVWNAIQGENCLQFLDAYRDHLMSFYSNLPQEEALTYYKGRGPGEQRIVKVLKAWRKNREIYHSKTMKAIDRYAGNLYRAIDRDITDRLGQGEIKNVLIVSALLGIIAPTDLIPNYELMMSDKSPNEKVARFWSRVFKEEEESLDRLFSQYNHIYCLMSRTTGYIDSVTEILSRHDAYCIVPLSSGQSNKLKSWGYVINDALRNDLTSPDEIKQASERYQCEMVTLKDHGAREYKNHGINVVGGVQSKERKSQVEIGGKRMKSEFDEIWNKISEHEGETFKTITGKPFTYTMDGEGVYPSRTDYRLSKTDFRKAYELVPIKGPGVINQIVRGPAYIWAIIHDARISQDEW